MRLFTLISIIITWLLIPFWALVRLKGAGMACPDWPLCYGQIIPPPGLEIALEMIHRGIATFLGICIIGIVYCSFRKRYSWGTRFYAIFLLILVVAQGIFGALTVTMSLQPEIVTGHLIGGNLLLWCLIHFYVLNNVYSSRQIFNSSVKKRRTCIFSLWIMNLVILLTIVSGGMNSTNYAGYVCDAFPLCHSNDPYTFSWNSEDGFTTGVHEESVQINNTPYPTNKLEWIHLIHRIIAISGGLIICFLAIFNLPNTSLRWKVVKHSIWMLIFIEIGVGVLNAVWKIPVPISALHSGVASTLVAFLAYATALCKLEK